MILFYSERTNETLLRHVQDALHDTAVSLNERMAANDTSEIFSADAFVMIFDCRVPPLSLCRHLALTSFAGSKILYCLFFAQRSPRIESLVKNFTAAKGLVLFGYDTFRLGADKHADARFRLCADMIRDCRPFAGTQALSFPYRTPRPFILIP